MKKTILTFGLIAGFIVSLLMLIAMIRCQSNPDFEHSMWLGYASMIIAFSFVFIGIRSFRENYNEGTLSFQKGFVLGLWITLIASTMYVITWLIYFYNFAPDFMEKYSAYMVEHAKKTGASAAELDKQLAEMAKYKELYKSPVFVVLFTYFEILPVGLVISLISALILKRK